MLLGVPSSKIAGKQFRQQEQALKESPEMEIVKSSGVLVADGVWHQLVLLGDLPSAAGAQLPLQKQARREQREGAPALWWHRGQLGCWRAGI